MKSAAVERPLDGQARPRSTAGLEPDQNPAVSLDTVTWPAVQEYAVLARTPGAPARNQIAIVIAPNEGLARAYARAALEKNGVVEISVLEAGGQAR